MSKYLVETYYTCTFKIVHDLNELDEKNLKNGSKLIELNGPYEIRSKDIKVASDPSSAAFFIVGALITPGSKIQLNNIALNPTRIEYINVLKKMTMIL